MQDTPQGILIRWFSQLDDLSVLGLLLSVAGVAMLLVLWQGRRSYAEELEAALRGELTAMQRKLNSQASALSVLGERVLALEDYLELVGERQQQLHSDKRDPRFYQQALRLADRGLDADSLVARCGISRSEAELIASVRGRR